MLASWLFSQYLLSNDVQVAYAETEGYTPVTTKAQQSEAYQSYLADAGKDDELHYDIKISASRLLMDYTSSTFVTPVFNGSTSLRNAAGQLIERVTKSARRKETIDDAYMEKLFSQVTSLYHLDQNHAAEGNAGANAPLGPLPAASRALIAVLICTWVLMGLYLLVRKIRHK